MTDLRFALRTLAKSPVLSAIAVFSLALGIGANAAIFSLLEQVLLKRANAIRPEELVLLSSPGPKQGSLSDDNMGGSADIFSYPMFRDLEAKQTVLAGVGGHRAFEANLSYQGVTENIRTLSVSGGYFPTLGLNPSLGRLLTPDDDRTPGAHRLVVLSHDYWREKFGASPAVLNQAILVNGIPLTVVGVAPAGFEGFTFGSRPRIYVPLSLRETIVPRWTGLNDRNTYWIYAFARLKPGVAMAQAEAGIQGLYQGLLREVELPLQEGVSDKYKAEFTAKKLILKPGSLGQSRVHENVKTPVLLLFAITGFVLLIACANIANLLLARSAARTKEFAVRLALGASRGRLMRQLLSEAMVLAVLAGVAGLVVCVWTGHLITTILPPDGPPLELGVTPRTALFAMGVSLVAGLLFGLFPAYQASRQDLSGSMKDQSASASATGSANRFRRILVTAQISLSLVLLISAGMLLKSLVNLVRADVGLRTASTISFQVSPYLNQYSGERTQAFLAQLEQQLRAIPGAQAVTVSMVPLLSGNAWGGGIRIDGFEAGPDDDTHTMFNQIGPGFFRAMGIPLIEGREFTEADGANAPKVAIVNEAFVRKFSSRSSILGKRSQMGGGPNDTEIVGVVRDTKYHGVREKVEPIYYRPYQQTPIRSATFYINTALPVEQMGPAIRGAVRSLDPNLPVEDLQTFEQTVQNNIGPDRMISILAGVFAALATLLAAIGLYGVLAYSVTRRTREIGIRLAIGAQPASIRNLLLREVGWMAGIGAAIALPAGIVFSRFAQTLLYEIEGADPVVLIAATAVVVGVALLAAYLPARRAMAVDPMEALRYE
jgi:predicted permease